MKGLLAIRVCSFLIVSLVLSIVSSAPTADQAQSVGTSTSEPSGIATTEEELEFKDVPIFEKDEPSKPAPAGAKYVAVLKCGDGHGKDAEKQHVSAPPSADGQRSQDQAERSPQTIHEPAGTDVAPTRNKEDEEEQTSPTTSVPDDFVAVKTEEKVAPVSDSLIASSSSPSNDDKEDDKKKDVESIPSDPATNNEPVLNILVVSDETGKLDVKVQNLADPVVQVDQESEKKAESVEGNQQKLDDNASPVDTKPDLVKSDEFEMNGEMIDEQDADVVKDYTGYKVYRVTIPTEEAARWILKFEDVPGIEFWADPKLMLRPRGLFVTSAADMFVAPDVTDYLEEAFKQARLPYEILIQDVQEAIRNENPTEPLDVDELTSRNGHRLTWERYHSLDDIDSFVAYLKVTFPDFVTVTEIGKSTENRPIKAVRLRQKGGRTDKKSILIDAGIHAREWITPATITYMIREIIDNPQKYECIMNEFDWIFVPTLNPDGYNYTFSHNRMWRKTRSPTDSIVFSQAARASLTADRLSRFQDDPILDDAILEKLRLKVMRGKASLSCTGADANRNFDYHWLTGGSSRNPCSEIYAGPKPFSEPEARALRDLVLDNKDQLAMYISLHAYSQIWLLPWGYKQEKPEDFSDLYSLAKIGSKALETVNGVDYMIGSIPDLLYVASGSSIDWVKGAVGIKYAFTLELRDSGRYGFLLPASQILPSGKETWAGLYATAVELSNRIYSDPASCPATL